ncbi:MAG: DEAD/DEAH box helicase [Alphaproteobacteria bacterium]|nr:DEAD/DEAH box helicase [Alphaproteobacteria bacterium]MBU2378037.1 DEAD/DEAH box helicase [Alphaproteobacteria bacterium]
MMNPFATLDEIRRRTAEGVIGQTGINHPGLASEIRTRLGAFDIAAGGVTQAPLLEAALPYVTAEQTLGELAGSLLHPSLVDALEGADTPDRPYRFERRMKPYAHQLDAWRALSEETPRSVLVTSGTGSGKTECFLVPILDSLARQAAAKPGRLEGVQAIMLYPLNALIASQQERLRAWTRPFGESIRFALYNGLMKTRVKAADAAATPEEVVDRVRLRASPPPILVTNVTMLEYMLLRPEDAPILGKSRGNLRYIVLDEAHSYVGAKAAEIALLLRRVCLAFGVSPADVRVVATSATIGRGEGVERALEDFLADVSGAPRDRVSVIQGHQRRPELPALHSGGPVPEAGHFDYFGGHPNLRPLLEQLYAAPLAWSQIVAAGQALNLPAADLALKMANAESDDGEKLAPLRVHTFHRAVSGLWSCLDPGCSLQRPAGWPFGAIHHQLGEACSCGAPLFEVVTCSSCGEPFLDVEERPGLGLRQPRRARITDEFAADADRDALDPDDDAGDPPPSNLGDGERKLVALCQLRPGSRWLCVEPSTGVVHANDGPGRLRLAAYDRATPQRCPGCGARERDGSDLIRPVRFGAPFILGGATPVLLADAAIPEAARDPVVIESLGAAPPSEGRQLLSFTDSRQGTARLSAKLQTGSERNFVRSVIYHAVQDRLGAALNLERAGELRTQIELLRAMPAPEVVPLRSDLERQLAGLETAGAAGLPWNDMVDVLAERPEVRVWIGTVWAGHTNRFSRTRDLAEFLLLREFIRRPPRANAPETLGLARLRFAVIDNLVDAQASPAFIGLGGRPQDWRDFLHLLTTFVARGRSAVQVPRDVLHWIPPKSGARELLFQPQRAAQSWEVVWPRFTAASGGRTPMIVNLLCQAFNLSPGDAATRTLLDDIFRDAWHALGPVLRWSGQTKFALDFRQASVAPVTSAWYCPSTRRMLDVTLKGLSPYGARTTGGQGMPAERLAMPRHPVPYPGGSDALKAAGDRERIGAWLADDPAVAALRDRGAWSDLSDRIAYFSDYFRSAEHSAQQRPGKLRAYELAFKTGAINVLNCSTTMEMGVDIGSVSHVMMTNLPPSIANYRQRIGRAGRRGQPISMGFTFCKDRPLDRDAFCDPERYLNRQVRAPKVALDSRVIVQRHVNALLFAAFVRSHGANALSMQAGPFFGCDHRIGEDEIEQCPARRLADWARAPETREAFGSDIERLTRHSVLAADDGVWETAAGAMEAAREAFAAEWRGVQSLAAGCRDEAAALERLAIQLRRLCQDYLLSVLANRGVLPGHGFPTDVVSFVIRTETRDLTNADEEEASRFNAYPQRQLDIAIREYAPGSEIVLDGLVHKSAGVTLNWKQPATAEAVHQVQALLWRWSCETCGESGSQRNRDLAHLDCPVCRTNPAVWVEYLQPAGFAVDLRAEPHADADVVTYVPPEPTAVSARGADWGPLPQRLAGRWRATREGTVFFCNAGPDGDGYSLCLRCGRADEQAAGPHRPLVGSETECGGPARQYALKTNLRLGHQISTDVLEFQPADWPKPGAGMALAVALREALARRLGVETDEMGIAIARRTDETNAPTVSIFLHDKASGGAGFSIQALELLPELLPEIERILDCAVPGCVNACPACVLAGDLSDDEAAILDRSTALAWVFSQRSSVIV